MLAAHHGRDLGGCQISGRNIRRQICPVTTERFKFGGAWFILLPSLPISLGFENQVAFRMLVARPDYPSGLMPTKKLAKPVTGTRGQGPTVTRAMPPPASRGIGLRRNCDREPTRIRTALLAALVEPLAKPAS